MNQEPTRKGASLCRYGLQVETYISAAAAGGIPVQVRIAGDGEQHDGGDGGRPCAGMDCRYYADVVAEGKPASLCRYGLQKGIDKGRLPPNGVPVQVWIADTKDVAGLGVYTGAVRVAR